MGDAMTNRAGCSFHAVLFGGVNDLFGKAPGQTTARDALLGIAIANALKDMRATLEFFLNVPGTNILRRSQGTYAELGAMITNAWRHMNDNEQFILFIADHGSRYCQRKLMVPRAGGHGFSATFTTEPYLKSDSVQRPVVAVTTSFVGAPGEVRFNAQCIGTLPPGSTQALHEFVFNPNLIKPVGQDNLVEVVVPYSNVAVERLDLSTGPVLGSEFTFGAEPLAAVLNVRNGTGSAKTGFQIVYEGRLSTGVTTRARRTQSDGTPIADWAAGGPIITYDPATGLTTVSWEDAANPIPDGGYASFSVVETSRSLRSLKYAWTPASPDPAADLVPVNLKSIGEMTPSVLTLSVVAAPLLMSTQSLGVTFRFTGNRIPASQLYFNDPAITSLPRSPTTCRPRSIARRTSPSRPIVPRAHSSITAG
jgi:hypothetical protein